ncbi:MAG: phage integrase SAM-like domain-containing protein [Clostridia bacterium]|nr:phage integrase SAM-like domain-containing protein [Clostridia bacterium]
MTRKKRRLILQTEMTYVDVFEEFIRHKRIVGLAEETINAYTYNFKYLGKFIDVENELIKDIDPRVLLSDYVEYLKTNTNIQPITIATYIRHVVPVLKYAISREYIEDFKVEYPKYQNPIKEIYTEWELKTYQKGRLERNHVYFA